MDYLSAKAQSSSSSSSQQSATEKLTDDAGSSYKNVHNTVTCVYDTLIGGYWRNVTVVWGKNLMNYSLTISVDSIDSDNHQTCKIDLKPWHFWARKGYKAFEIDGQHLDVYWDMRAAKFSGSPEPCTDFYVALTCEEEVVLLVGDRKKKAFKRTKYRPALLDAVLFYKKENVFGKKCFSTRAKFDGKKKEYDIVVESAMSGPKDPEMWISIDGIVLIHVQNLHWKFRGNQTIMIDKLPLQVFWDVHAWLFSTPGSSHGLFIFKPGESETESEKEDSRISSDSDSGSVYYSTRSHSKASQFCLFLYAWKIE